MRTIDKISDLMVILNLQKKDGNSIGFVPTMGFLHEGHLSLAKRSKQENSFTVMSIFVNPIQFGVNEDFDKYPADRDGDLKKAQSVGVDVIFIPSVNEMYPEGYNTYVEVFGITGKMCGKSRPGHFKGVTTIVLKLFNIVQPDKAYFGQKDAQQAAVLKKMVKDLNVNIEIVTCPIIREEDGLAMSSRNVYLNAEERKAALVLSRSLYEAEAMIQDGERDVEKIYKFILNNIGIEKLAVIDYVNIADADTLEDIKKIRGKILVALAVKFGKTRLIDNIIVEVKV
jgi:pantoate--beta-alanine ligase